MAKALPLPVVQSGLESSIDQVRRNIKPINVPVNVDPSAFKNLAQPLGRVSGLATEFEKSIAASNARVLAFGASVGIINGVQNAFASLLRTGIEVQKTLAEIAAISGRGGDDLSKFGDSLFEIGKLTGQSFKIAAQAALEFSRQGLTTEETLKRTTDALTLTRFTTLNAAEAVDVLTAAANSFGGTGITTAEILNKLVAVDTKFAVSAEDLANGLARAGSIAQEVGVSFDELNAAITIAQERTARGGSVIGNALKTIFTRLRSDETVQSLRAIGVESLNAQGGLKAAIPLLEEVAQKLQGLSEGERVQILEAIASKYNINILSAILTDLSDANKKFGQVVGISAGAGNQAYERQIELNKALAAQINVTTVTVEQLSNKLSEIGVTESLTNLLKFVNGLLDGINKILDSESTGGNIAKGLIKGISDVFFTVGLPLLGAIFIKLTKDIAQFGVESLKTILGINQQVRERQALEQAVVNTLIRDQEIMATILSLSGNRAKQEEYLLSVYNKQLAALQQVQSIAAGVAPALQAAGLSATSGTVKRRAAEGYLPAAEARDVRRGVGGASPSSKVVEIPNFSFGGGKRGTMVANTSEYIVPNYAGGSGTAIFNQDMAKQYGLPSGAKKITASGGFVPASGFVPNFAKAKFNVQNPRKRVLKENESKSSITNIDLDNMLPSAYLTISNNLDTSPVGVFSSLQEAAKQKLQEKLGQPIDPSARVEGENIEIKKIQNSYASGGQLIGSIIDAQRKIQSGKANIKKESQIIVDRIVPETSGGLDDNLRNKLIARVENEIKTTNSPFFAGGNILEDVLFASTEGGLQDRNSRSWDLPKNISPSFKKAFNLKSDFADIKLGKTEKSMSSFLGKHITAPSGTNASRGYIPNFINSGFVWKGTGERLEGYDPEGVVPAGNATRGKKWERVKANYRPAEPEELNAFAVKAAKQMNENISVTAQHPAGAVMLVPKQEQAATVNKDSQAFGFKPKDGLKTPEGQGINFVKFAAFGVNDEKFKSKSGAKMSDIQMRIKNAIGSIGADIANDFKVLTKEPLDKDGFYKLFDKKQGAGGSVSAVAGSIFEAATDYTLNPAGNPDFTDPDTSFDVGSLTPNLIDVFDIKGDYGPATKADFKISEARARAFADQVVLNRVYKKVDKTTGLTKAAKGYIPNFVDDKPLKEAIEREVGAGVPRARVRVTQDNRLQNSRNPDGLAVINTRDEPDGKIPNNFRKRAVNQAMASIGFVPNFADKLQSPSDIRRAEDRAVRYGRASYITDRPGRYTGGDTFDYGVGPTQAAVGAQPPSLNSKTAKEIELTTGKLMTAFVGLQIATNTLQSTFKDTDSTVAKALNAFSQIASTTAGYGTLGSLLGDTNYAKKLAGGGGAIGRIAGNLGPIGMVAGLGIGAYDAYGSYKEGEINRQTDPFRKSLEDALRSQTSTDTRLAVARKTLEDSKKKFQDESNKVLKDPLGFDSILGGLFGPTQRDVRKREVDIASEAVRNLERERGVEIQSAATRRQEEQKRQREERAGSGLYDEKGNAILENRIALQTKLSDLTLAFTQAQIKSDQIRFRSQEVLLINANKLTENQARQQQNTAAENSLIREIQDTRRKVLEQFLLEIGNSNKLSNAEKEKLAALEARLLAGEDVLAVEQEIAALGIRGSINLSEQTQKTKQLQQGNEAVLIAKINQLRAVNRINEANSLDLFRAKERLKVAELTEDVEKSIQNTVRERRYSILQAQGGRIPEPGTRSDQSSLNRLNYQIAGQANPTFQQIAERTRLTDLINRSTKINELNREEEERAIARQDRLKGEYKTVLSGMNLPQLKIDELQAALSKATTKEQFDQVFKSAIEKMQLDVKNPVSEQAKEQSQISITASEQKRIQILNRAREAQKADRDELQVKRDLLMEVLKIEENILSKRYERMRAEGKGGSVGRLRAFEDLKEETKNFSETFSYETTFAFRDGLRDAIGAAISETDDLNGALQAVAINFLKTLQGKFLNQAADSITLGLGRAFSGNAGQSISTPPPPTRNRGAIGGYVTYGGIKGYADGGKVIGGSGVRDDVPAMLSAGEYVIRKSSVQKYGENNLKKLNSGEAPKLAAGGFFLPGVRGASEISGYKDLSAFARQTTTSGATDTLMGGRSTAFASLEDQSQRLSAFALTNDDTINQEIRDAQEKAYNVVMEREAYRTQQRKAYQRKLKETAISAALTFGISGLASKSAPNKPTGTTVPYSGNTSTFLSNLNTSRTGANVRLTAYGGLIKRYNTGGGPTDDIPALLMGGEYVMSRQATKKYGKQFFDSVNQGRAPRFANGGQVSSSEPSFSEKAAAMSDSKADGATNISININVNGQSSDMQTEGETKNSKADYKQMSKEIEQIVLKTLAEQKRAGGMLRPNR